MKRDMELVRQLLLVVEAAYSAADVDASIAGGTPEERRYHLQLLVGAGYLVQPLTGSSHGQSYSYGYALTWEGHELLDAIRDDEVWRKTKAGATKVGSWSVGLLAEMAKGYIKLKAQEAGLPIN